MKVLKSKYHAQGFIIIGKTKKLSGKHKIEQLPIKDIWASVPKADFHRGKPFYPEVMEDIKKNGLVYPIMVLKSNYGQVIEQKKKWGGKLCDLPFDPETKELTTPQLVCWGGSQRLRIAEELGYTHIDCAIMKSYNQAHKAQKMFRAPYEQRWYKP